MKLFKKWINCFDKKQNQSNQQKIDDSIVTIKLSYGSKPHNMRDIDRFIQEIQKTKIWNENYMENDLIRSRCVINVKKEDKFILNEVYKYVYGWDIYKFTAEELREQQARIRKEKLIKIQTTE